MQHRHLEARDRLRHDQLITRRCGAGMNVRISALAGLRPRRVTPLNIAPGADPFAVPVDMMRLATQGLSWQEHAVVRLRGALE
jgi:hypothetical protein